MSKTDQVGPLPNDSPMLSLDEKKVVKGRIYSLLFKSPRARIAIIPSIILGLPTIVMFVITGRIITVLYNGMHGSSSDAMHDVFVYSMIIIGVSAFVGLCKFVESYCWLQCGAELSATIRKDLFGKLMLSDVAFFDTSSIGNFLSLLSEDTQIIQESFGPVKGIQIGNVAMFLGGIIGTFVYSWKIGLVFTASFVLIGAVIALFASFVGKQFGKKFFFLAREMTIAEEAISSIKTVRSFNREDGEICRFHQMNSMSEKHQRNASLLIAFMMMLVMSIVWGTILGNLYFAATLMNDHKDGIEIGDLLSIFGFCMNGSMAIISLSSTSDNEGKAIESGARIIRIMEYQPTIQFEGGNKIDNFKGEIEFKNVSFKYPTRPTYALQNVSFVIKPGQIGALVGHSGSGKSTCIQLIERFYDVTEGEILLDGIDIKTLDPRWIHQKIGIISQEPTLFNTSIKENILYGKNDAQYDQVLNAADIANARKFIDKFDQGFDTVVGEKGSLLSGGQKQRIAIARAIIRDPIILIADEATSALDSSNEKKVQVALNKVMENRTSLIVAHRLSTIRNADIIYVFVSGQIKERGNHQQLLDINGVYYNLVSKQIANSESDNQSIKNEDSNENNDFHINSNDKSDISISSNNDN